MAEVESITTPVEEPTTTEEIVIGGAEEVINVENTTETTEAAGTENAETEITEGAAEDAQAAETTETTPASAEPSSDGRLSGVVVKWILKKGYGFIKVEDDETEIFCHRNDLKDARMNLNIGENVDFVKEIRNDKPRALDVKGDGTGTKPKITGKGKGRGRGRGRGYGGMGRGMMYGQSFNPYAYQQMMMYGGFQQGWGGQGYGRGGW